jgi:hypothetical protein
VPIAAKSRGLGRIIQLHGGRCSIAETVRSVHQIRLQDAEAYQRLLDIAASADAEESIRQGRTI